MTGLDADGASTLIHDGPPPRSHDMVHTPSMAELQERATGTALLPGDKPGVDISPDKTVATVSVEIAGDGTDDESNRALDYVRGEVVPPTVGSVPGVEAYVGGSTAMDADFNDTMKSHLPYVFGFVLTAAFLLLLGDVPVGRRAAEGDRPEPPVRRRDLRPHGAGLPARAS